MTSEACHLIQTGTDETHHRSSTVEQLAIVARYCLEGYLDCQYGWPEPEVGNRPQPEATRGEKIATSGGPPVSIISAVRDTAPTNCSATMSRGSKVRTARGEGAHDLPRRVRGHSQASASSVLERDT